MGNIKMEHTNVPKSISILLVHPCEVVRHSIGLFFQKSGFKVLSLFDSSETMLEKVGNLEPDIVVIHYSLCKPKSIIKQIIEKTGTYVSCIASSDSYHKDCLRDMLELITEGMNGFLDMDQPVQKFLSEIQAVASGDMVISKNFIININQNIVKDRDRLENLLSRREIEIINMVGNGNTNKEIGKELIISEHTVKVHLRNILAKLNLKNRQQVVAYFIKENLITEVAPGER